MYSFDPFKLYKRLVPYFLRRPIVIAWLQTLSSASTFLQGLLLAFVTEITYDLTFNAQVIYLEYVLNDQFDSTPDIYIENIFTAPDYLYNDIEVQPPTYYRNDSEGADPVYLFNFEEFAGATQFIVHCAASLSGDEDAITALIELYNLAGMPYEIVFDL